MKKVNKYEVVMIQDTADCIEYLSSRWFKLTGFCAGVSYSGNKPVFKFYLGDVGTPEKPKKAKFISAKVGEYVHMCKVGIFIIPDAFAESKFEVLK